LLALLPPQAAHPRERLKRHLEHPSAGRLEGPAVAVAVAGRDLRSAEGRWPRPSGGGGVKLARGTAAAAAEAEAEAAAAVMEGKSGR